MSTSDVLTLVIALAGVLAALVAWLGWRQSRQASSTQELQNKIRSIIREEILPIHNKQLDMGARIDSIIGRETQMDSVVHHNTERIGTILDRLMRLETQTEVFWKSVGIDMAKILHQPDPRREHIDNLLEQFMEGTLTPDETTELRKLLVKIRNWEPGTEVGFPVYQGEQTAAAILLAVMEHHRR